MGVDPKVPAPKWQVMAIDKDGLEVTWEGDGGLSSQTKRCIGVWFSASTNEYMLTQKTSEKTILQKNQIGSISWKKIKE